MSNENTNKESEYFKNLQPGQQVFAYKSGVKGREYEPLIVERLTATQIVCVGGRRFKDRYKSMPHEVGGDSWVVSPHYAAIRHLEKAAGQAAFHMTVEQLAEETARLENLMETQEAQWP